MRVKCLAVITLMKCILEGKYPHLIHTLPQADTVISLATLSSSPQNSTQWHDMHKTKTYANMSDSSNILLCVCSKCCPLQKGPSEKITHLSQ